MEMQADGRELTGNAWDSIWIPRGTDHEFTTTDEGAHVLNGYAPDGVEQIVVGLATSHLAASCRLRSLSCRVETF